MIILCIPDPPPALRPNSRKHWMAKARAVKIARTEAFWIAQAAGAHHANGRPMFRRAIVDIVRRVPTRRHVMDRDNLIASLKAAFDGLADAGIVGNDRDLSIGTVEHAVTDLLRNARPQVFITIRGEEEEQ